MTPPPNAVTEPAAAPPVPRDQIERRVRELAPWFHNLDLFGVRTAPGHFLGDYPNVKWQRFAGAIPADLSGKTVLDVGVNAGFYALEMLKRGADRVVGIDTDDRYLAQARLVAELHGARNLDLRKLGVYDVGALGERFDVVLFMGVLYHLRHPLLALDLIHDHALKPGGLMVFQCMQRGSTEVDPLQPDYDFAVEDIFDRPGYPKLHFIEKKYAKDPTNWWAPNAACMEAMLRSSGFEIVGHPEQEVYLCRAVEIPDPPEGPRAVYPARGGRGAEVGGRKDEG